MKVFISWSQERSRLVAELLDEWIQCVLQAVDPWMSSKDIDGGSLWFTEISDQLATTSVGIVCLTKENKNRPWILFESGALAKGLSANRVCTFLIDLEPTDLENPLAQFNHTKPDRNGMWKLVKTINVTLKETALKEPILQKVFETYWPQFEAKFAKILKDTPEHESPVKRDESDVLNEVLSTVRGLERRIRKFESTNTLANEVSSNDKLSSMQDRAIRVQTMNSLTYKIDMMLKNGSSKQDIANYLSTINISKDRYDNIMRTYFGSTLI